MEISILNFSLAIGAGLASVLSPCVLPVVPVIIAGAHREDRLRPLLIVMGLSMTFIAMGVVSSLFGSLLIGKMRHIERIGGAVIFLFGIMVFFDVSVFKRMHWLSNIEVNGDGRFAGLLLGMALGVVWMPCIGPILSSILAMVGTSGEITKGILFLSFYSFGFALPMIALGYSSHLVRSRLRRVGKRELLIRLLTGGILMAFGLYIFFEGNFAFLIGNV